MAGTTPAGGTPPVTPPATDNDKFIDGTNCRTGKACTPEFKSKVTKANGPEPTNDVEETFLSTNDESALDPYEVACTKSLPAKP